MGAGLGNQMNIYAAALKLSIAKKVPLYLDVSWFDSWPKYGKGMNFYFGLDRFKISSKIASKKQISRYLYKTRSRYLNKIFRKFRLFEKKVYEENRDFNNPQKFLELPGDLYIRGYYNKSYYDDIVEILRKELQLKKEYKKRIKNLLIKLKDEESVSIHIRRGDLLKMKNTYVLPMCYYIKAIQMIRKKTKKPRFYIFSQDMGWCKDNFSWLKNKTFIVGNSVEEDFELMKNCKYNITANSSLSWWAAYLNNSPKKIVIAPRIFTMFPGKNFDKSKKIDKNIPFGWLQI